MTEIYDAGRRIIRLRLMMLLTLAAAIWLCWEGWDLINSDGLAPGDGGVLAPLGERIAWGLGVAGLGLAFASGMWLYCLLYIRSIQFDRTTKMLHVRNVGMFVSKTIAFPAADVLRSTFMTGRLNNPDGVSVNAPGYIIWVLGRRCPFILDGQGASPEPKLLQRVLKAR